MKMATILPGNKRLKQLITQFGNEWEIVEYRKSVSCLYGPGYLIQAPNSTHKRWIEETNVNLIDQKGDL